MLSTGVVLPSQVRVQGRAGPGRGLPSNMTDEYAAALSKMREDIVSLAAKAVHAGVADGDKWQLMLEMLPDRPES
jgi:hypothetical protein